MGQRAEGIEQRAWSIGHGEGRQETGYERWRDRMTERLGDWGTKGPRYAH